MEYVFRCLFAFAVTWVGCMLAMLIMRRSLNHYIDRLEELDAEIEDRETSLSERDPHVWTNVSNGLPTCDGDYVVEFHFEGLGHSHFAIDYFYTDEGRFENEGYKGMTVDRWAHIPK